jgi:hypothetical protein
MQGVTQGLFVRSIREAAAGAAPNDAHALEVGSQLFFIYLSTYLFSLNIIVLTHLDSHCIFRKHIG